MAQKEQNGILSVILLMAIVACTRFISIPGIGVGQNFTALGGLAIFSGVYFKPLWKAVLVTLLTYFVSDIIINVVIYGGKYGVMYQGFYVQYILIASISLLSHYIVKKLSVTKILASSLLGSIVFYIASNFMVWASGGLMPITNLPYDKSMSGLMQCYINGLPFAINFLLSTCIASLLMVGVQEYISKKRVIAIA
jgi:hypothetical protein